MGEVLNDIVFLNRNLRTPADHALNAFNGHAGHSLQTSILMALVSADEVQMAKFGQRAIPFEEGMKKIGEDYKKLFMAVFNLRADLSPDKRAALMSTLREDRETFIGCIRKYQAGELSAPKAVEFRL